MTAVLPQVFMARPVSRIVADIAQVLESARDVETRLSAVLELLGYLVPFDNCVLLCAEGLRAPRTTVSPYMDEAAQERLCAALEPLLRLLTESHADDRVEPAPNGAGALNRQSNLAVPLVRRDRVIGLLAVEREASHDYTEEDHSLLTVVASQLAAYLDALDARARADEERAGLLLREYGAQQRAEAAAELANRLHTIAAGLAQAATPQEVVALILEHSLTVLRAEQGSVVALTEDGSSLDVLCAHGYPPTLIETWLRFPVSSAVQIAETVRTGVIIVLTSLDEAVARYPLMANVVPAHQFWVTFPLLVGGRIVGGVGLSAAASRDVTGSERQLLLTLANLGGQALERARLYEAERTARQQAAAERDCFQQVLDLLPEAVTLVDSRGQYVLANRRSRELLGTDVLGSQLPMGEQEAHQRFGARHLDGTPSPSLELPLQRSLLNGEVVTGYRDLLRHAGSGRDVQILANSAPLLDDTGAVTGAVSVFQDITPLNEQEHAREDFLGAVAHDLKNPLTAIRGHAQLGRRRLTQMVLPGADRVVEQFTQIETSTAGMLAMINELLDMARLHAGADLELQREPIDFVVLLGEAVARQQEMSSQHIHHESEVPTLMVHLDHSRMDRVLANVLSNAASYSQESTAITVRLAHVRDASGDWAEVTVQDQGIGIPAADLPHVFDRFHRGANAIGRIRGTGIGLATAQKIIEQHGGTILLSSQEGIGTTVRMRLPLEPATSRVDESPAST